MDFDLVTFIIGIAVGAVVTRLLAVADARRKKK